MQTEPYVSVRHALRLTGGIFRLTDLRQLAGSADCEERSVMRAVLRLYRSGRVRMSHNDAKALTRLLKTKRNKSDLEISP